MESLLEEDIRLAEPGEFTLRAFLNGKLDLSQAEAVADLIASESEAAHQAALTQMRGGFSNKLKTLREELLHFASLLELELDFAEEDVEFANRAALLQTLSDISAEVSRLASSFSLGNVIKSGVKTVIAGRPNAGKSTLLNALLEEERAIVSDIPGTTRDTIEDVITIEGIQFRFIDTAGIRSTEDTLENIGIQRTYEKLNEAQLIIYLFDVRELSAAQLQSDLDSLPQDKPLLIVGNKIDRANDDYIAEFSGFTDVIYISGRSGQNLEALKKKLVQAIDWSGLQPTDTIVTNVRHYRALQHILNSIQQAATGLTDGLPTDLVAMDIRHALQYMGEITGEITNDEILGNIFSKFCIGK
jgi:tRNA modification GTPase